MQKNPTMLIAAAALVDSRGKVLLQRRPPGRPMGGLWEFPGGKVEPGETPEIALGRELMEELGIQIDRARLTPAGFASAANGAAQMVLLLYICREWTGEPQPLEATELKWVFPAAMVAAEMPPADQPLIAPLAAVL